MKEMGMKDIRVKNLAEIVKKNKVVRIKHYNDTAFFMLSPAQYLKLTAEAVTNAPPKVKRVK